MTKATLIRDLFAKRVTRDIPPVVYFKDQSPAKLADEVSEYIFTGGWPEKHPRRARTPEGIHESFVKLLRAIADELDTPGGPSLPTCWISGFYGSGKSSFAKLLGLALDGVELPGGRSLADALLARNTTPRSDEFRAAWDNLVRKIDPIAVVFDAAGASRVDEHVHTLVLRKLRERLGYCTQQETVADFELQLERDGEWKHFEQIALATLGKPWSEFKNKARCADHFSRVMHAMFPEQYTDPGRWADRWAGSPDRGDSPEEVVTAIGEMLRFRRPGRDMTLFIVVDEVSQHVLGHPGRIDSMRAFASALGTGLHGRAWLLALGQQQIEKQAGDEFLAWARDRFPPRLRVHLAHSNIRDVVHRRLLEKTDAADAALRALFARHRADLKLFAHDGENIEEDDFVEVYPLLPKYIELIMQITSAMRARSSRAQGDDQAIRGLLQLLGELFRGATHEGQRLIDAPIGALITFEQIYEVQHTALDAETQASMARILRECEDDASGLMVRVAKVVALLEQIQETLPTTAPLIAQCLFDRLDRGDQRKPIADALEELHRRNLISYSEKDGYKIQSTAGEEWERDRRELNVKAEAVSEAIQGALRHLLAEPERGRLQSRLFPWKGLFSDSNRHRDAVLEDPRDEAAVVVDFRFLADDERDDAIWIPRSQESTLQNRIVWVCGRRNPVLECARELGRSQLMVEKYKGRRPSLPTARRHLLDHESDRAEALEKRLRAVVADTFMAGAIYFRGSVRKPSDLGSTFALAINAAATADLPKLFPDFIATNPTPAEILQLIAKDLAGVSTKFIGELGILRLEDGRYEASCEGTAPRLIYQRIEKEGGLDGASLLLRFSGPPFGYAAGVVKACVAGLLRGGKITLQLENGEQLTYSDGGVQAIFKGEREFRRVSFVLARTDGIRPQERVKICKLLEQYLRTPEGQPIQVERDDNAIADAVAVHFPDVARELRTVETRLRSLPGSPQAPELEELYRAIEACSRASRRAKTIVQTIHTHFDALSLGLKRLREIGSELSEEARAAVQRAVDLRDHEGSQLIEWYTLPRDSQAPPQPYRSEPLGRITAHLGRERPWQDIKVLDADIKAVRDDYVQLRGILLTEQDTRVQEAIGRLRDRDGFRRLSSDASDRVLDPIRRVRTDTSPEAVAPTLRALTEQFDLALRRAVDEASARLDEFVSRASGQFVRKLSLSEELRDREVKTEADVERLVTDIRARLLAYLREGERVRLS